MRNVEEISNLYSESEILSKINQVPRWTHAIELGCVVTPGIDHVKKVNAIYDVFPNDFSNKSVLDIGTRDGKWAFEAERRNAKEIVAIDSWQNEGEIDHAGSCGLKDLPFNICKEILDSKVQFHEMDVMEIEKLNKTFDVVLFLGVIYHLSNPFLALKKIFDVSNDLVILEGSVLHSERPMCYFLHPGEVGNDPSNKFLLSPNLIINYAKEIGFNNVEFKGYCAASAPLESDKTYAPNETRLHRNRGVFILQK